MLKAQRRLIVTTDEPTALTDVHALIKVTEADRSRSAPGRLMVAINVAACRQSGASTFDGLAGVQALSRHVA